MDVIGTISSVVSLAQITAKALNRLILADKINADLKKRLETLCERNCEFQSNFHSIKDKFVHEGSTLSEEKCKSVKMQMDLVSRTKRNTKTALNVDSITETLDTIESSVDKAINVSSQIMLLLGVEEVITSLKEVSLRVEGGTSSSKPNVFCKHFNTPEVPTHVVLNYMARDESGEAVTAEGRLVQKVIALSRGGKTCGVSAVGSHGMGGVGKTTALRGLCYVEEVKKAYPDGIFFVEFGEDANDEKVSAKIKGCVQISGGDL
eukprot:IDg19566t1